MKAVRLHAPAGIDGLVNEDVPVPSPQADAALVRVHAAAITRDELNWPLDRLPAIPSYELSGVVVNVEADVDQLSVGEAVFGLTGFEGDGVAAEFASVPVERLGRKPESLGHVEAAAIPLAGLSAIQGLFDHGGLKADQSVLIHGGGGGVGAFAVQLARLEGAHVVTTASGSRVEAARDLGADEVIDSGSDFTGIDPVDLVFDTVGGDRLVRSVAVVKQGGRIVSVAEPPPADLGREQGIEASFFIVEPNAAQLVELARLADQGDLRVLVDSTFPLDRAREAFERLHSGETTGKVVLTVAE
jgi:NADPH:quinone reductase-like Zn-dependent oxidoreductase